MTDALIEAVARAIYERIHARHGSSQPWSLLTLSKRTVWMTDARAALAAIEQSGYAVVPVRANFITGRSPLNISDIEPAGEGAVYIDGLTLDEAWQLLKVKR